MQPPNSVVPSTDVLGVPISLLSMEDAVATLLNWARRGDSRMVCIRDVHGVMLAQKDAELMAVHREADMVTADGMPLVWVCKSRGFVVTRVCGPDLVGELARASQAEGMRHYFYGGKEGVAERMAHALKTAFPGIEIAGCFCPPFRALSPTEDAEITNRIAAARPHFVWVGLSTPKQERWMRQHVGRIPGATLIGVGAAFDVYAGEMKRAPKWMQGAGLEWLYRLASEPKRLWRRYLVLAPAFLWKLMTTPRT